MIDGITTNKVNVSDIIDNLTTPAANKPLSSRQGKVLKDLIDTLTSVVENKVDKVSGKDLSSNDFTTTEKNKLNSIAIGANVNVQPDWNVTDSTSDAFIKNKPDISGIANIAEEVNNLKKSVSDGKNLVASAITEKGVTTAPDAAFATMASNIAAINSTSQERNPEISLFKATFPCNINYDGYINSNKVFIVEKYCELCVIFHGNVSSTTVQVIINEKSIGSYNLKSAGYSEGLNVYYTYIKINPEEIFAGPIVNKIKIYLSTKATTLTNWKWYPFLCAAIYE